MVARTGETIGSKWDEFDFGLNLSFGFAAVDPGNDRFDLCLRIRKSRRHVRKRVGHGVVGRGCWGRHVEEPTAER